MESVSKFLLTIFFSLFAAAVPDGQSDAYTQLTTTIGIAAAWVVCALPFSVAMGECYCQTKGNCYSCICLSLSCARARSVHVRALSVCVQQLLALPSGERAKTRSLPHASLSLTGGTTLNAPQAVAGVLYYMRPNSMRRRQELAGKPQSAQQNRPNDRNDDGGGVQ